jgi:ATP adenylyltransferase
VLVTGFYGIIERFRLKGEIKTLVSTSREKDKELNSLRNLPITSDDVSPSQVDTTEEE